jgi:hypothetical protein
MDDLTSNDECLQKFKEFLSENDKLIMDQNKDSVIFHVNSFFSVIDHFNRHCLILFSLLNFYKINELQIKNINLEKKVLDLENKILDLENRVLEIENKPK